jgi:1-acyl-sn-glycerol-3-phosphate acyltransferase
MNLGFYRFANWVCRHLLLPLYCSVRVSGIEKLPRSGPLLLVSNHLNDVDPALIGAFTPRTVVSMAKVELFRVPVVAQFMRVYGAMPVRRNEADLGALRRAIEALDAGLCVCIFPEGRRSGQRAALGEAWPGAGLLALRSGAPIVPLAITGSQRMGLPWLIVRPFPRQHITMSFGEPFTLEPPARLSGEAARAGTQRIMTQIAALLPPEYRGYYGNADTAGVATPASHEAGD